MLNRKSVKIAKWAQDTWIEAQRLLETESKCQLDFPTMKEAIKFRFALYTARLKDKMRSREIYSKTDPEYNSSVWEDYRVCIIQNPHDDKIYIEITKQDESPFKDIKFRSVLHATEEEENL